MLDNIFDLKYGVAGICVLLTLYILFELGKFVWVLRQEKDSASDVQIKSLTEAMKDLTLSVRHLEAALGDVHKMKIDVRRFYTAVKSIAGDRWPSIRDEILAEDEIQT